MSTTRSLACLLTASSAAVAAAQMTVSPPNSFVHVGQTGAQPSNAAVTYTLSNPTLSGLNYVVTWDPEAIPNTPMRVNGSTNGTVAGFLPAFNAQTVTVTFEDPTDVAAGLHTLQFIGGTTFTTRAHQLDIGTITISEFPAKFLAQSTPGGVGQQYTATVQSHLSYDTTVQVTATDWNVSLPAERLLSAGDNEAFTVDISMEANMPLGRYEFDIHFEDTTAGIDLGTRVVTTDYGRYVSPDMMVAIPSLSEVSSTLEVQFADCLADENDPSRSLDDISVELQLAHNSVQDLEVTLEAPDGRRVVLHNLSGGGSADIRRLYGIGEADGPGDLGDLRGMFSEGTWTLHIRDILPGDDGVLESWALIVPSKGNDRTNCPPWAKDIEVTADSFTTLVGLDGSASRPFHLEIDTLPNGTLQDWNDNPITTTPYVLPNGPVWYTAGSDAYDTFQYSVVMDDTGERTSATVAVRFGTYFPYHIVSLDQDPGWTTEGAWAHGQPTQPDDPNLPDGDNIYAYGLDTNYENDMAPAHLTSTAFDLTNVRGGVLSFDRWLQVGRYPVHNASVSASRDGVTWETLWSHNTYQLFDSDWQHVRYDLSSFDGEPTVYLRWTMGATGNEGTYTGWNINNVAIEKIARFCSGDVNADLVSDLTDLAILLSNFGRTDDATIFEGDINLDGAVDLSDLALLLAFFGSDCR